MTYFSVAELRPAMYKYNSLPRGRYIRVIHLKPALRTTAALAIDLVQASIDPSLNFEALSYAWEGQDLNQAIQCGGKELLVSATCMAALRRLRRKIETRILWIDQICMDQNSNGEKNHQVALMGEIYGRAMRVVIWLGDKTASERLLRYARHQQVLIFVFGRPSISKLRKYAHKQRLKLDSKLMDTADIHVPNLHPVAWFDRMWAVQEAALAQKAEVMTAERRMDYDTFMKELLTWFRTRLTHGYGSRYFDADGDLLQARHSVRMEILYNPRSTKKSIPDAVGFLCDISAASTSVASDKTIGLRGIFQELGFQLPKPDYTTESGIVYWETLCTVIKVDKSLQFLELVHGLLWRAGNPSWVPNLSRNRRQFQIDFLLSDATGISEPKFTMVNGNRNIATHARIVDRVDGKVYQEVSAFSLVPGYFGQNGVFEFSPDAEWTRKCLDTIHILQIWIQISSQRGISPSVSESGDSPILPTVTAELRFVPGLIRPIVRVLTQLPFAKDDLGGLSDNESLQLHLISLLWESLEEHTFQRLNYLLPLFRKVYSDPLCKLGGGYFKTHFSGQRGTLGSASSSVGPGDVVALIPGVRALLILRLTGPDTYQVLGPAYVDSMMEGGKWYDGWLSKLGLNSPEVDIYDELTEIFLK